MKKIFNRQDLDKAIQLRDQEWIEEIEKVKGLGYCNESCFHITNRNWQALKSRMSNLRKGR